MLLELLQRKVKNTGTRVSAPHDRNSYPDCHFGHLNLVSPPTYYKTGPLTRADRLRVAMKFKLDRIISIATLLASLLAIFLVLKKPTPVAQPQASAAITANAQSFDQKLAQLEQASQHCQVSARDYPQTSQSQPSQQPTAPGAQTPKAEVHISSDEIGAVIAQSLGEAGSGAAGLSPDSNLGSGAPTIKDQRVSFDRHVCHRHFLTPLPRQHASRTLSAHL